MAGVLVLVLFLFFSGVGFSCPKPEELYRKVLSFDRNARKIFSPDRAKVVELSSGFCLAVFVSDTVPRLRSYLTISSDGRFVRPGRPYDLYSGRTVSVDLDPNPLSAEFKQKLKTHSFLVYDFGPETLYVVLSPSCPFCQRMAFYFMMAKESFQRAGISLRLIPYEHGKEDTKVFSCVLQEEGPKILSRIAGKVCFKGFNGKAKENAGLFQRIASALSFSRSELFVPGVPLIFDGKGELVARGFDPLAVERWLGRKTKNRKKEGKDESK